MIIIWTDVIREDNIPTAEEILDLLKNYKIVNTPHYFSNGGNFANNHTPVDAQAALKKIEFFIGLDGEVTPQFDRISVPFKSTLSHGYLHVFRVGEDEFVLHGVIEY